jgi:hypothetical protein
MLAWAGGDRLAAPKAATNLGTVGCMAEETTHTRTGDFVDERGITITAQGRERARQQLADLDAHWTSQRRAAAHEALLARLYAA